MAVNSTLIASKLKHLRESFIHQLPSQLKAIKETYATIDNGAAHHDVFEELHQSFHTLRGASANFGLHALSDLSENCVRLIKKLKSGEIGIDTPWRQNLDKFLDQIEREITRSDLSALFDLQALEIVAAADTFHEKERKVVYLCEDDKFLRLNLATQISYFGFEVITFGELDTFSKAIRRGKPDIVVMDIVYPDLPTGGADVIREIQAELDYKVPTVFISARSDLPTRLAAIRAGGSAYFVKPIDITDFCTALHTLTTKETPEPYRIMIIDDDPLVSEMTAMPLQKVGMETKILHDPLQALPQLLEFKPDLILLDMYMPGCSGMELAKAIRQMDAYFSIPIIFLSSESDMDVHYEARQIGGDEFLVKPIKPNHLVSTVSALAERMKIIRSFIVRDSMTGLYNYTAIYEHLNSALEKARRYGESICFAMIDLDHFKKINDQYGHQVGDRVLMTLSRMLRQRLRKSDVIGRTGGEEFAVILPSCHISDAVNLLRDILENFAAISFPVGEDSFSSTFSCGVASFDGYDTAEKLYKAADDALYAAKRDGRNRVLSVGEANNDRPLL